jgi:miniconductance mechanosensitive channel
VKLVIVVISVILAICIAFNLSPWGILSGVGALGAILLLVFKDTILGLVASIQVYGGNLLKEGDWIELKALDIDGEVMEVGLHRVKVKAWDNTIATFPTSKFLELTFKNWRGMKESGGRRIKRKIILTMSSIKFVDSLLKNKLEKLTLLESYLKEKEIELENENKKRKVGDINRRTLTNIGCFRIYTKKYLENHPYVNKKMTLLVRQLPINQFGLPIEIYTFTSTTDWNAYEDIQSDIFDHIIASTKYFDLDVYQEPSSIDIKSKLSELALKN